jgi:hypothetical protein
MKFVRITILKVDLKHLWHLFLGQTSGSGGSHRSGSSGTGASSGRPRNGGAAGINHGCSKKLSVKNYVIKLFFIRIYLLLN